MNKKVGILKSNGFTHIGALTQRKLYIFDQCESLNNEIIVLCRFVFFPMCAFCHNAPETIIHIFCD